MLDYNQPQPAGEGYDADELGTYRRWIRAFETNKRNEQEESRQARKYYHDKQWTEAELRKLKRRNQPPVVDNGIKRKIDFLVGVEQRMRRDPKAYPRTPKHEHDADTATASVRFVCDQTRWEMVSSDSMRDGLISGIGVGWVGIKRNHKTGALEVDVKTCDSPRFIYDPRSTKADFSDARWSGVDLWLDIDEAKEQHPEQADQFDKLIDRNRHTNMAIPAEVDQADQWGDLENRRVRICELYVKKVAPPYNIAVWHYCKFSGEVKIESYISPYLDEYGDPGNPYVAWSPYVDEKGDRYGIVRTLRTLQDSINHKRSRIDHEISNRQTFSNRGGTIEDVDKFKEEVNKPDGHLTFNGGEWNRDVGIIDRSNVIRGHAELLTEAQARMENYGPNPGLIGKGQGVADASGRALLAQRDSGMTELSAIFERHRTWKLQMFRLMWARIRQAWTGERWIAVTDDPKAIQFLPVNKYEMDPMTGQIMAQNVIAEIDVDIILDEGPDVMVMQEELMQTFSQLGEAAAGPLGKILIQLSNVPMKEQLLKMLDEAAAPSPEVAQMQALLGKLEALLQAAKIDEAVANVENKRADTLAKLVTATTPQAPQTDEFGRPMGPAPQPNVAAGFAALQAFPLQYGQPTIMNQAEMAGQQAPPMPEDDMMDMGPAPPPMPQDPNAMMPMEPAYGL